MKQEDRKLNVTMRDTNSDPQNELRRDENGRIETGESPEHNESIRSDDKFDPTVKENDLDEQRVGENKPKKEKASFDSFVDTTGPVSSRSTGSNPDDIAGVADLDNRLKR